MTISFSCPHCQRYTEVADRFAGQSGNCVECGKVISIPAASSTRSAETSANQASWSGLGAIIALAIGLLMAGGAIITGLTYFAVSPQLPILHQALADSAGCATHMQNIGDAISKYVAVHGQYPPAYIADSAGTPLHSWRVLLLPYLGYQELFDKIDLTQPWDSPANLPLQSLIPQEYQCPSDSAGGGPMTSYLGVSGGRGYFFHNDHKRTLAEIRDGAALTAMVVECAGTHIHWMEPRDLNLADLAQWNHHWNRFVGSMHADEKFHVITADGRVRAVPRDTSQEEFEAMATIDGGEPITPYTERPRVVSTGRR